MCTTPAPPSTAFVAASIWSGTGEVKTSPGHAASSIPAPTKPSCIRSAPEAPARDDRHLAGRGVLTDHDLILGVHAHEIRMRRGEAGQGLVDDVGWIVDEL